MEELIRKCGLLGINDEKEQKINVPLKEISVESVVKGFTARIEAKMIYENQEDKPLEAVFVFPLDEQSAVYHFQAVIENRTIVAECQEKQEARRTYETAKKRGHTTFLLEEDSRSGDTFTCSLGNLPPHKDVEVSFRLVTELPLESDNSIRFTLPQVLNPRYDPECNIVKRNDRNRYYAHRNWGQPAEPKYESKTSSKYKFSFKSEIIGTQRLDKVMSEKDNFKLDRHPDSPDTEATVTLENCEKFVPDHDLTFHLHYSDVHLPHVVVEKGDSTKGGIFTQDACLLTFLPDFNKDESYSRGEFIFVVDRSGSMSGSNMRNAKETLLLFLKSLPVKCFFQIVSFGSSFELLFPDGAQPYNEENLDTALRLQRSMEANLGGTEMIRPLEAIYRNPPPSSQPRQIFLLTDGDVSNASAVHSLVRRHADNTRVFAFGIGEGASTALVKGIARAGRGKAEFAVGNDRLQPKVMNILQSALQAPLSDLKLDWDLPKQCTPVMVPQSFPPVFRGDRLLLYAILDGGLMGYAASTEECSVTFHGRIGNQIVEHRVEFMSNSGKPDPEFLIRRLAVKRQLKELSDEEDTEAKGRKTKENKGNITQLSLEANMISKYTSFVGVDKNTKQEVAEYSNQESEFGVAYDCIDGMVPARMAARSGPLFGGGGAPKMMKSAPRRGGGPPSNMMETDSARRVPDRGVMMTDSAPKREVFCTDAIMGNKPDVFPSETVVDHDRGVMMTDSPPKREVFCVDASMDEEPEVPADATDEIEIDPAALMELIHLTKFNGSWDMTADLVRHFNRDLASLERSDIGENVWATILVLVFLEKHFAARKEEWTPLANKAKVWLNEQLGDDAHALLEHFMNEARNMLP